MSFTTKVNEVLNKHLDWLDRLEQKHKENIEKKRLAKIAKAKSLTEKLRAETAARKEQAKAYQELLEAKAAAKKAADALKAARVEAGDLSAPEAAAQLLKSGMSGMKKTIQSFSELQDSYYGTAPKKRSSSKKSTSKKSTAKKTTATTKKADPRKKSKKTAASKKKEAVSGVQSVSRKSKTTKATKPAKKKVKKAAGKKSGSFVQDALSSGDILISSIPS